RCLTQSALDRTRAGGLPERLHARGRDPAHDRALWGDTPRERCGGQCGRRQTRNRTMSEPVNEGKAVVTAALLVIGDQILSGRTKDKNIGYIADHLTAIGIQLKEVRIVADEEASIVEAVNALRARYDYVFTTGGIGPTHDDITADSIAKAFGVGIDVDA